jgi:membrane-associated phospholipid phosphatase
MSARRFVGAALAALAVALCAPSARAEDPSTVVWAKDWPRVRLWEGLDIIAVTVGSSVIVAEWQPRETPGWRGGILFDDAIRSALRGRTYSAQDNAATVSDYLYKGAVFAPYIIDNYIVALGIHQSVDVAFQMTLIDVQSLGLTGVLSLAAERAVGRARPYTTACDSTGAVRDANGHPLLDSCGSNGDYQSFYSGHSAATATMAGLTCAHHQHLPLYGGGFADLAPCLVMIGASATTGITRVIADRHWASDVVVGWSVGALSGYVLPSVLHYGFGGGKPALAVQTQAFRLVPVPQVYAGGAGAGVVGVF